MTQARDGLPGSVQPLRVGSWPGPSYDDNEFIAIFCDGLRQAGAEIVDIVDPHQMDPATMDVIQVHWAEQIFWRKLGNVRTLLLATKVVLALRRLRKAGVPVFWLVHNLRPHDASRARRLFWNFYSRIFSSQTDYLVTLSPATIPMVEARYGKGRETIAIRHPSYPAPTNLPDRDGARARLSIPDAPVLLAFVGSIKPYKGVEDLIAAAQALDRHQYATIIAGRADAPYAEQLLPLIADAPNIVLRPQRLASSDFETLVRAADFVVIPMRSTLHSGSIVHALSLGRPVVTQATPFAEDLATTIGEEWIRLYRGKLTSAVIEALGPPPTGTPDLSALSPAAAGRVLTDAYRRALADRAGAQS